MEDTSVFTAVALPIALAVIMISLGLELTRADFKRIFVYPKGVAIGLLNLAVIAPLLAFGIAELFNLPPILAIGLVLLGASPGGTMANLLTHLARGDTALSVTMTALSSLGALIVVPIYLNLAANHFSGSDIGDISMLGVVARVFFITLVPLAIGMYIRERYPRWTEERKDQVKKAAFGAFVLVVIGAVASEIDVLLDNFTDVALATLALNVAAMSVSFTVAKLAQPLGPPSHRDRDGAGHPQLHARDRRRRNDQHRPGDSCGRLLGLHVHHRRPLRPLHGRAKRRARAGSRHPPEPPHAGN